MTQNVFISGSFNILHTGHHRLFKFAQDIGDKLIIGVFSDKLIGPEYCPLAEDVRIETIRTNPLVDEVLLIDEPIEDLLLRLKPSIIVKGKEFEGEYNVEASVVETYGGKIVFSSGQSLGYKFTDDNLAGEPDVFQLPLEYMNRHEISVRRCNQLVNDFNNLNVVVIGDLIVDEYITCEALGMSQEDPTLVVTPINSKQYLGGAGIVASHATSLGANVTLLSVIGEDTVGETSKQMLTDTGVHHHLFVDSTRPTTLKQRFRVDTKTLLRVSHLSGLSVSQPIRSEILSVFKEQLNACDVLVFSDFNYGCLPQDLVDDITKLAKESNTRIVADSQSSSQLGDVSRFENVDLLTPTEKEARLSLHNQQDGLLTICEKLRLKANVENVILKLGSDGLLLHFINGEGKVETDKLSALNRNPIDVAGAGDSLLITSSLVLASNGTFWEAALLGNLAAAIQVSRIGNQPIICDEFYKILNGNLLE